jgi:carboxylesterase type B
VGEVIGTTTVLPSATVTVNKFLGIPFAVSPPDRFAPPLPAKKFSKPMIAQAWSPSCIQQFNCESGEVLCYHIWPRLDSAN